ncbi:MAG TPA: S41 family peptidase, partial [Thermodesulfobacteriota bacterium]|nr:S41 family peptidase [Thermodesulfobacteriota bacterium]
MKYRRHYQVVVSLLLLLGLVAGGRLITGCKVLDASPAPNTLSAGPEKDFRLMAEAWNRIRQSYVDQKAANPRLMTYGAIGGMVDSLGDTGHSRFLNPEMVQQEMNLIRGKLEGIGAEIQKKNNQITIVAPIDGSPAEKAGLKPGEVILKVEGKEVSGLPLEQVASRILGPSGTPVQLTILNPSSGETKEMTLLRANITLRNVTWQFLPETRVVHLRIASFSRGVSHDLKKALTAIRRREPGGIILDLRNNPGGIFGEAVRVASQFLDRGNVALERNSAGEINPVPVEPGGLALTTPMVVLVNEGTASAPEIVAGAMQDSRRARVVGETTFGTGTVLEKFSLSDGSALLLATEEWLTPAGRTIWHRGISPDFVVSLPPNANPLFPQAEKDLTEEGLRAAKDEQLLRALDLLSCPAERRARRGYAPLFSFRGFIISRGLA